MADDGLLVLYLRPARRKARAAATEEALCLFEDLHATAPPGGPLSEQGSLFWITVPSSALASVSARCPRLGYTCAVDHLLPAAEEDQIAERGVEPSARLVRWRRKLYRLDRIYEEDPQALREAAVDRRTFLLENRAGEVHAVRGYRGDSHALSRRGLPVYDARLLVNLVRVREGAHFLDPFAGTGGIVIEALAGGATVASADIDPALRHGLAHLGAQHHVADARHLPFVAATFDAIATEPPYHADAAVLVGEALREMERTLKFGGRIALLCAAAQAGALRQEASALGLRPYLDAPINRKGLDVTILAWGKA